MSTDRCGAAHPDNPEVRCMVSGYHPEHFDGATGLSWENEDNPPPADRRTLTREVSAVAKRTRRRVIQSNWVDPGQVGGGQVAHDHPETSQRAADNVRVGSQQSQLLLAISASGNGGMTAFEATPHVLNGRGDPVSPNQCNTRMGELRAKGLVRYGGWERETTPGNMGRVFVCTPQGQREAARLALELSSGRALSDPG